MMILKIIGIGVLYVLAFFLLLLCLFLFVPIRYRIDGRYKKKESNLDIYASWLFSIITLQYLYGGDNPGFTIRLFGFTLGKRKKKVTHEKQRGGITENKDGVTPLKDGIPKTAPKEMDIDPEDEEEFDGEDLPGEEKTGIFAGFQVILDKVLYYYQYPDRDAILKLAVKYGKLLFTMNKPKSFALQGEVGFETPDTTGYFIGMFSVLKAFLPFDVYVKGNYGEQWLEGHVNCRGKASFFTLGYPIIRFLIAKPVWKIVKNILFNKNDQRYERNESYVQ